MINLNIMKSTLLILLAITISIGTFAQDPDQALARVSYTFSHIKDTTQRDKPYIEQMLLVIGKNASLFTSYDKINMQSKLTAYVKEQTKANGGTLQNLVMQKGLLRPVSYIDMYTYFKERQFITIENMTNKYLITESIASINWKITTDTASFSGIPCQKAIAYFKGRNWIAWYAKDLPFQSGPWKLNGLPGLIIEAYDEQKDIEFRFAGMEKVDATNTNTQKENLMIGTLDFTNDVAFYLSNEIKLPKNTIKTTMEELNRLKLAKSTNPAASSINSQPAASSSMRTSSSASSITTLPKSTFNNPIELPEKIKN